MHCSYVAWICRAEDLVLAEERTTEADRVKIMEARQKSMEKMKKLYGTKPDKKESVETNSDAAVEEGSYAYVGLKYALYHFDCVQRLGPSNLHLTDLQCSIQLIRTLL